MIMQKTETYKLNLIDMDDTFSPEPINENTRKLEAALAGAESGLDQRLAAIEAHRLVTGSYTGDGAENDAKLQTIPLGFDPAMVYVQAYSTNSVESALVFPDKPYRDNFIETVQLVSGGFAVRKSFNRTGLSYHYFAFA